jgi:hypothetical protein
MAAINTAYRLLSDPRQRAAYDARRYLSPMASQVRGYQTRVARPTVRTVPAPPPSTPPTPLQRRVDRIVAIVGVLLLIGIGFYTVNVIPYAERQFQEDRRFRTPPQTDAAATAQTVARASVPDRPMAVLIPDRLRSDSGLKGFPGAVLVAPTWLPPFSSLPVQRIDATGMGIARYAVYYGDLTSGGAAISGLVGRTSFDNSTPRLPDCLPSAAYCLGPVPGQASGAPGLELFRASDLIEDYPALVTHRVCCNGVFWSFSWYEPGPNMSYTLDLSRSVALHFGTSSADGDVTAARAVAALAAQLVRLP